MYDIKTMQLESSIPEIVVIAHGDRRKVQCVLELHVEIDVLRIRKEIDQFRRNKIREDGRKCEEQK